MVIALNTPRFLSILTAATGIVLVLTFYAAAGGELEMDGTLKTGFSLASRDCKVEYGSVVCSDLSEEESKFTPYFLEGLLDVNISGLFGPGDDFGILTEVYHPYTPYSGITFQAFSHKTLVGELATFEGEGIFSPNIILYTTPDKRTEWYGATFESLAFRRYKSSIEFGLVGLTADTTIILDNWQDEPEDKPDIQTGLIFEVSGETQKEVEINMETRMGVRDGVTCFGNCIGPRKLQQLAVQQGMGFEEFLLSVDNFPLEVVDLNLSGLFSTDNGLDNFTLTGYKTWEYGGGDVSLNTSVVMTPSAFIPLAGTSLTWTAEPFSLTFLFDETFKLENTTQSLRLNPDVSDLGVEGLSLSSQSLLGKQLNVSLTVPTNPVDFTAGIRFAYQEEYEFYGLESGIITAQLNGDPFSAKAIYAFRDNSRVFKLETELKF